jgi:hypothetical protein
MYVEFYYDYALQTRQSREGMVEVEEDVIFWSCLC